MLFELGVAEGDEIDDDRRAAVEEALARARARLFVVRSLAVEDAVDGGDGEEARRTRRATRHRPRGDRAGRRVRLHRRCDARRPARPRHAGARLRPPAGGAEAQVARALWRSRRGRARRRPTTAPTSRRSPARRSAGEPSPPMPTASARSPISRAVASRPRSLEGRPAGVRGRAARIEAWWVLGARLGGSDQVRVRRGRRKAGCLDDLLGGHDPPRAGPNPDAFQSAASLSV